MDWWGWIGVMTSKELLQVVRNTVLFISNIEDAKIITKPVSELDM